MASASIAAFSDNEFAFDTGTLALLRGHLNECAACRERLIAVSEASTNAARLLHLLDNPLPIMTAQSVIARAKSGGMSSGARIAAIAAAFGGIAVAAAALPPSPLHGVFMQMLRTVAPSSAVPAATVPVVTAPVSVAAQRGVSLIPEGRLDVVLMQGQSSGTLNVTSGDGSAVTISSDSNNGSVFQVSKDRITIVNRGGTGSYELVLPPTLAHASIRVGRTIVFRRDTGITTALVPRDSSGGYSISLAHVK